MAHEIPGFNVPKNKQRPPDPILGLASLYEQDPRPRKIDAGIGVAKDKNGNTFTPKAVKEAWKKSKFGSVDYLSPTGVEEYLGDPKFINATAGLIFQETSQDLLGNKNLAAAGTPGGTGAVALVFAVHKELSPEAPVLVSEPTWPNHIQIAKDRKIPVLTYPHLKNNRYDINAHIEAIKKSSPDTLVVFHTGKTHNSTGTNPENDREWSNLANAMKGKKALFDTAYAGFGDSLEQDTKPIRSFMKKHVPVAVSMSFSKNMGLYNKRVGGAFIPMEDTDSALQTQRVLNAFARLPFSSPPADGERIVADVLTSPKLNESFRTELGKERDDIKNRRTNFASVVEELDFVADQTGLFSMLPLNKDQVKTLRVENAIYMADTGRINIGGVKPKDIPRFAKAIKNVL